MCRSHSVHFRTDARHNIRLPTACISTPRGQPPEHRRIWRGNWHAFNNFYSDNVYRYSNASQYKNDPSHGRFDIPHAVIYISYDFGKGWSMSSEIELSTAEQAVPLRKSLKRPANGNRKPKGGEVELEQFWIQKSFARWANIRIGHIVVPVGLTNAHHEPLNFFTVYRPRGESTILPCTWHDTGISFFGAVRATSSYELQFIAGLDAFMFDRDNWVQNGAGSPFEFKVANKYGFAARIDNYTIPGLRIGLSGYYGQSMHNTYPHDMEGEGKGQRQG